MSGPLTELAAVFLKLGLSSFGGPAAHTAMMENELVVRRRWLTHQHFLDLVGATNLIPGPNSTEMTMHIGLDRAGGWGMLVAGTSFILPAALITGALAALYVRFGSLPQVDDLLAGVRAVVLVIILTAIVRLGQKAAKNWQLALIAVAVGLASWLGASEVLALFLGGLVGMVWLRGRKGVADRRGLARALTLVLLLVAVVAGILYFAGNAAVLWPSNSRSTTGSVPLWQVGLYFLFIGSVLYGSGYVLFAFLQGGPVETLGWLTSQQLVDAVAAGQVTPGPVFSAATFIGYLAAGWQGAVVATVAIFLPSFIFVLALNPLLPKMRASLWMSSFLDAINASAIGLMAVVLVQMSQSALTSWQAALIAAAAALVSWRRKVNSAWLIAGGGLAGWLLLKL